MTGSEQQEIERAIADEQQIDAPAGLAPEVRVKEGGHEPPRPPSRKLEVR